MFTPYNELKAIQNSIDNCYVRYTNLGDYISFFNVSYYVNGNCHIVESPFIHSCHSYTIPIPDKAKNIKVIIYQADEHNSYSLISNTSYKNARNICLTSYGNLSYAWSKEVYSNGIAEGYLPVSPASLYAPMSPNMYGSVNPGIYPQAFSPMANPSYCNPMMNCHC